MARNVSVMPDLGKTWYGDQTIDATNYGRSIQHEGTEWEVDDIDPSATEVVKKRRSNRKRLAMLVRNVSGGALTPGTPVKWAAGFRGRRVDAAAANQGETAGFVDEMLPAAGVKDDDLFWIIVDGPVLANKATGGGTAIANDAVVISVGSGNVAAVGSPADAGAAQVDAFYACGRVIEAAVNDDTKVLIDARCRG